MANVDGEALDVESRVGGVHFQPGLSNSKTSVACVQSGSPNYLPFSLFHPISLPRNLSAPKISRNAQNRTMD